MNTATSSGLVPSRVAGRGSEVSEENSAKDSEIKRLKDENNKLEQQLSNLRVSFSLF
jgi:cell division protein FtsB